MSYAPIKKSDYVATQKDIEDKPRLERIVDEGEATFISVGNALTEIRDRHIYLIEYETFEEYCQKHWGWSSRRAYQMIDAASVVGDLPPECEPVVHTERAARALQQVPVKHRIPVLRQVQNAGVPVTARAISEAAKKLEMPPEDDGVIDADEIVYDDTGYLIPKPLVAFYLRGVETRALLTRIADLRGALRRAQDGSDPLFRFVNISTTMALLDNTYGELKMAVPYAVCPYCQGKTIDHCTVCRKTGFLPKHQWDHAVPSDLKAVREKSCKK